MFDEAYDLAVVIPAKGPSLSVRVPNKNALPFGNKNTLLEWKISQLLEIIQPSRIYVSTEYEPFKEIARNYGVNVHNRNLILSDETKTTVSQFTTAIISEIEHKYIAWVHLTNPLTSPQDYRDCFNAFHQKIIVDKENDSLFTVQKLSDYIWDKEKPVNYSLGKSHVYSTQLPIWFRLTCSIFMREREAILENSYYIGQKPHMMEINKIAGIDIDYPEDYEIAKALYPLYLEKIKNI